jgi:hypothetical protein
MIINDTCSCQSDATTLEHHLLTTTLTSIIYVRNVFMTQATETFV